MSNVVPYQAPTPAMPAASFTMPDMERVALAIAKGGLFGSTDPNAVLTLCMVAQAEGKHPGLVMQQYHIIQGKPAKKAEAMLVDFIAAGGRVEWHRLDDECADATFTHPAGGSARITWDKARVAQAQLGNNPMHKKYPRQMLRSRVVSEGVRTVFPGATSGFYVPEEIADFAPDTKTSPPAPEARRARDIEGKSVGRAKAEAWVADQTATVENCSDLDALDAIIAGGHKAVGKLAREHADLHDAVQSAYATKAAELQGYQADADAEPAPTETPSQEMLRKIREQIAAAKNAKGLAAVEGEWVNRHRIAFGDDAAGEIDALFAARRRELSGEEG